MKLKVKRDIKSKAIKEAEQIFMKLNPQYAKSGFPKVDEDNYNTQYGKEAMAVEKQVVKIRLDQERARLKAKRKDKINKIKKKLNINQY